MRSPTSFTSTDAIAEEHLRHAIANQELTLLYQPKVSCLHQQVVGAEALVRWAHPTMGLIPPDSFIGLAEQSELIHDLGNWVIRAACRQLREWRAAGALDWTMAVNVSPRQLQRPGFYALVCAALGDHGIPADRLVLEVTESELMDNPEVCLRQLFSLFGLGVQISLDDFGTGFSCLGRLKQMPVHELKIAREFLQELDGNAMDHSIVAAIIGMATRMELRVVAEGVEREEQRLWLQQMGCDQTQGYLHAPPINATLFLDLFGVPSPMLDRRPQPRAVAHE